MYPLRLLAFLLACAAAAPAQSRVTIGANVLHENQYVDLDTGTVLSRARLESVRAEWKLETDEGRMRLVPCEGATLARWDGRLGADGPEPDPETFSDKPVKVEGQVSIAGKTSEGRAFKAILTPPWPPSFGAYATMISRSGPAELQIDFAIAPSGAPAAPPAQNLRAHYLAGKGIVAWQAAPNSRWRVEWFRPGVERADGNIVVSDGRAEIGGLAEGKVYRIEVRPVTDSGFEGEPRAVPLLAGGQGLLRFKLEANLEKSFQQGVALDLRQGRAAAGDPDCMFDWSFVSAPEGGGVQWLGDEKADFDDTRALPEFGYRSRVMASLKGGVYAVRMRDGRFAKIWFDWDRQSRDRGRIADVHGLILADGGLRFNSPPEGLRGSFEKGCVRLSWSASTGAARYAVTRRDGSATEDLGTTAECSFEDAKPPLYGSPEYGVCWIGADGVRSAPASAVVETWPPEYARGTAKIEWIGGSFDFRTFKATNDHRGNGAAEADIRFDRRAMAAEGIPLICEGGIAKDAPGEFGRFDWKEAIRFRRGNPETRVFIPHRLDGPVVVRLLTRDGGYAHVRLEQADGFDLKMTWVHLAQPKPPDLDTMARELVEKAPQPAEGESKTFEDLVAKLGDDDAEARDAAEAALKEAGLKAVRALVDAARKTEDAELRGRALRIIEKTWLETE